MLQDHVESQLKTLEYAYITAYRAVKESQDHNYHLPLPPELLNLLGAEKTTEQCAEAWELIDIYQKSFETALRKIEEHALKEIQQFCAEKILLGELPDIFIDIYGAPKPHDIIPSA